MKEPVEHILRPLLPWRSQEGAMTECGYDASKVKTVTREAHVARIKELGKQRTAMITCMTCSQTTERWKPWSEDPRAAIGRAVEWEYGWHGREDRGDRLRVELLAIEKLIEGHREEFERLCYQSDSKAAWLRMKDKLKVRGEHQ